MILRASNLSQFLGKILGKLFQQKFMERFCNSPFFGQAITKLGGGCLAKRIVLAWFCGPLTILFNCWTTFSLVTI